MTLTPERIEEIRKRMEAATPMPWFHRQADTPEDMKYDWVSDGDGRGIHRKIIVQREALYGGRPDYAFIAHAPQDISDLLSAYDALSRDGMREVPRLKGTEAEAREFLARTWEGSNEFNRKYTAKLIRAGRQTAYDRIAIRAICEASAPKSSLHANDEAKPATGHSGNVLPGGAALSTRESGMREALVKAAEAYTAARECAPVGDWQGRLDERGWELAEAVRAYHKSLSPDAPRQKVG